MKVTKYEHACLVVEEIGGKRLVIDPGGFTTSLPADLENVVAIVITHVHQDHLDKSHIEAIKAKNPDVQIFGTAEVAEELNPIDVKVVTGGNSAQVVPFDLKFYGGEHAQIHKSIPIAQNVGVLINDKLYYPGDSFTTPGINVDTLALPVSAPWLKLSETMDFLIEVRPEMAFSTHNALLSDAGQSLVDRLVGAAQGYGGKFKFVKPGHSIEV